LNFKLTNSQRYWNHQPISLTYISIDRFLKTLRSCSLLSVKIQKALTNTFSEDGIVNADRKRTKYYIIE